MDRELLRRRQAERARGADPRAQQPQGPGNAALAAQVMRGQAAGAARAVVRAPEPAPEVPYVDQQAGPTGKSRTLARLFAQGDTQAVLTANGYTDADAEMLAGIMGNEGARNERRRALFNDAGRDADALAQRLRAGGVDLAHLGTAEIPERVLNGLDEDQRAMLDAARAGNLDLSAATTTLGRDATPEQRAARAAARNAVGEHALDRQVALYGELRGLEAKGNEATREEAARRETLRGRRLQGGGTMGSIPGLTDQRFRDLYADNQTRFENARYTRGQTAISRWLAAGGEGDGPTVGPGRETARAFVERHPEIRQGNYDALADIETSWGTAQIMGHYADMGRLRRNNGNETYTMGDMRASADRLTPTATDVDLQVAYMRDVAGVANPGARSNEDIATAYNGAAWRTMNPHYADRLQQNRDWFREAQRARTP